MRENLGYWFGHTWNSTWGFLGVIQQELYRYMGMYWRLSRGLRRRGRKRLSIITQVSGLRVLDLDLRGFLSLGMKEISQRVGSTKCCRR